MEIAKDIEKSASKLIEKTREDLSAENWLKKATSYETKKNYKNAIDAYLKFLEIKLHIIQTRPEFGVNSYMGLVKYYIKIAECYENILHVNLDERAKDIENSAGYYVKAAEMFLELKDYPNVQKYYETAAKCYEGIEKYGKTAECYVKVGGMYIGLDDKVLAISAYTNAAKFYEMSNDYEKSMEIWVNIANLNLDTGNTLGASSSYKKTGDSFKKMGRYQESLNYYLKSAEIITETEHYAETAELYERIASSYENLRDYNNTIHYYLKSADLNMMGNGENASSDYRNLAICYEKLGEYEEAIKYYLKSCDIELKLKHYMNLVSCYNGIAKCYDGMNEYKKSADAYLQSVEYAYIQNKDSNEVKEGYKKAAEVYIKIAEEELNKKNYKEAAENYRKVIDCYDKIREYRKSADTYCRYADIMKGINSEDWTHAYNEAAERYAKSGDMKNAADCYARSKNYANSAKFYKEYAELNKDNQFLAAEGYRRAAYSYKKLKKADDERNYYNKAISQYLKYMEKLEHAGENIDKGDIYRRIAECYNELDDMPNTKNNLEESLKFYEASGAEKQKIPVDALLSKANAKLAIKVGEYLIANKLLNEALALFDRSIMERNSDEEYKLFSEENKSEILSLLGQIKLNPVVVLNVEQPVQQLSSGAFEIKGVISNKGDQDVYGVLILPNIPQGFQIVKSPETIEVLKPNESRGISIRLNSPPAGEFKFAPLEVLYKDMAGNKYIKASNEISIKIQ